MVVGMHRKNKMYSMLPLSDILFYLLGIDGSEWDNILDFIAREDLATEGLLKNDLIFIAFDIMSRTREARGKTLGQ